MFDYLISDLSRKRNHYVRIDNFVNKYLKITFQLGTIAVMVYRLGAWSHRVAGWARYPARALYYLSAAIWEPLTGMHVNPRLVIGRGFVVHNFSNIIVDAASIGENFTINQGVTVGADWRHDGLPRIGQNVFLGAGAKVLGNIELGDNVVVAANALVERSVPDNCTVVGVPARIIARDSGSSYLRFNNGNPPASQAAVQH